MKPGNPAESSSSVQSSKVTQELLELQKVSGELAHDLEALKKFILERRNGEKIGVRILAAQLQCNTVARALLNLAIAAAVEER